MLSNDVAQYLHNQSIGVLASTLFEGYLPSEPDACIAVIDTGGPAPDAYLPTKEPTFQILIRDTNYANGKNKIDAVRAALHQQANTTLGIPDGTYFYFILATSEGGYLGRDGDNLGQGTGRDLFSINFRCRTR